MSLPDNNSHESTEASPGFQPDSLAAGISIMLLLTVGQRCVGFARQVLVCRYLDPDDLGRWNLAFSMMMLLAPLFVLGLPGTFNRYAEFYRHRGQVRSFFRKTLMATLALTLLGSMAMLMAAKPAAWLIFSDTTQVPLVILLVPSLVSVIAFNSLVEMMSSLRQVRLVAYMRFGHALLFSLLALAMVIHFQGTTRALIASYALASLLTCAAVTVPILRTWRSIADQPRANSLPLWSKLLPFAGWIWLADLMSNLFAAADRYMMIHLMHGDPDQAAALIGQYHSSRIIPQLFVAVAILLGAAILPYLSNDWEGGRRKYVSHRLQTALKGFALAATFGGLLVILISPWLFGQVMGGKYAEGLTVLPMTLLYCTHFGLFCIAQDYLFCSEKGGHISLALIPGLLINVLLNFLLVPAWGLAGGVLATVIANVVSLLGIYWLCKRQGMRLSIGTWAATALPLCFFLPPVTGLLMALTALFLGTKYRLLFDQTEVELLEDGLGTLSERVCGRKLAWWTSTELSN